MIDWNNIIGIVLNAVCVYMIWHLQKKKEQDIKEVSIAKEKRDANADGTLALLRDKLMFYHEKYMERGHITPYAFESWEKMYKAYTALGGNGMIVEMDKDIRELPIRK